MVGRPSYLSENVKEILGRSDLLINTIVLGIAMLASLFAFLYVEFFLQLSEQPILLVIDIIACMLFIALTALLSNRQILISTFLMLTMLALSFYVALQVSNDVKYIIPDDKTNARRFPDVSQTKTIAYGILFLTIRLLSTIGILTSHQTALADIAPPTLSGVILGIAGATAWMVSMFLSQLTDDEDNPSVYVAVISCLALLSMIFYRDTTRGLEINSN